MIEINLVPEKFKKARKARMFIMAGAGVAAVVVLLLLGIIWTKMQKIKNIEDEIRKIDAESASLKDKIEEVKKFNAQKAIYTKKKKLIDKLLEKQSVWPRLLDNVSAALPNDMWLESLRQGKATKEGLEISIEGRAFSKSLAAKFIKNLEKMPEITDIETVKIADGTFDKLNVVSYAVKFLYKTGVEKGGAR